MPLPKQKNSLSAQNERRRPDVGESDAVFGEAEEVLRDGKSG
jgi:hypothetical protein